MRVAPLRIGATGIHIPSFYAMPALSRPLPGIGTIGTNLTYPLPGQNPLYGYVAIPIHAHPLYDLYISIFLYNYIERVCRVCSDLTLQGLTGGNPAYPPGLPPDIETQSSVKGVLTLWERPNGKVWEHQGGLDGAAGQQPRRPIHTAHRWQFSMAGAPIRGAPIRGAPSSGAVIVQAPFFSGAFSTAGSAAYRGSITGHIPHNFSKIFRSLFRLVMLLGSVAYLCICVSVSFGFWGKVSHICGPARGVFPR